MLKITKSGIKSIKNINNNENFNENVKNQYTKKLENNIILNY